MNEQATTICAWCLKEQGITPNENDSHGICNPHAKQMRSAYETRLIRGWNRTPSYIEQNAHKFAQEVAV